MCIFFAEMDNVIIYIEDKDDILNSQTTSKIYDWSRPASSTFKNQQTKRIVDGRGGRERITQIKSVSVYQTKHENWQNNDWSL